MKSTIAKRLAKSTKLDLKKAGALVDAGLYTPNEIMASTDDQLKAIHGIGEATIKTLRKKYGKK